MNKNTLLYELAGDSFYYAYKNIREMHKLDSKERELIRTNCAFRNTHLGERCFILGNGPSLKKVDLSKLQNEFVFTVNNFARVDNYQSVKTNVHLWFDYAYFEMRQDNVIAQKELRYNYEKIAAENPVCFVPIQGKKYLEENGLNNILKLRYVSVFEGISEERNLHLDISKAISGFTTVVQYAIAIAIYMGFGEIYLLGCDSTNIVTTLNCALNLSNSNMHAYKDDDTEERFERLLREWTMTDVFFDQYILFLGYKKLYEYCNSRAIHLVNCSQQTLINELPRRDLEEILK